MRRKNPKDLQLRKLVSLGKELVLVIPRKVFVACLYHVAVSHWGLWFCSAVPAKRASLPQHPGKAAAKASESSSSEESSDEEEDDDKKKKPVQVCTFGKESGC